MIIFDLDGTLADCSHRRHFVDSGDPINENKRLSEISLVSTPHPCFERPWMPDWQSFYEACDQDIPIEPVIQIMRSLWQYSDFIESFEIWSGRCESVRKKTEKWLQKHGCLFEELKMRPIRDSTPDDELKERWLNEALAQGKKIDFVVDDRKKVRDMWIRRGIFVFDVSQGKGDF